MKEVKFNTIIYGGSFNPLHEGHLEIIKEIITKFNYEEFVVQKVISPYYKKSTDYQSRNLVDKLPFKIIDDKTGYLIDFLKQNKMLKKTNLYVIGLDSLNSIKSWKEIKIITKNINILVFKRAGIEIDKNIMKDLGYQSKNDHFWTHTNRTSLMLYDYCPKNISSSQIRKNNSLELSEDVFKNYLHSFSK